MDSQKDSNDGLAEESASSPSQEIATSPAKAARAREKLIMIVGVLFLGCLLGAHLILYFTHVAHEFQKGYSFGRSLDRACDYYDPLFPKQIFVSDRGKPRTPTGWFAAAHRCLEAGSASKGTVGFVTLLKSESSSSDWCW